MPIQLGVDAKFFFLFRTLLFSENRLLFGSYVIKLCLNKIHYGLHNVFYNDYNVFYNDHNVFHSDHNVLYTNNNVLYSDYNVFLDDYNVFYRNHNVLYRDHNVFYDSSKNVLSRYKMELMGGKLLIDEKMCIFAETEKLGCRWKEKLPENIHKKSIKKWLKNKEKYPAH